MIYNVKMMKLIKATVISGQGPDHVLIETNLPDAAWPYTGSLSLRFSAAAGQGLEYLREHFEFNEEDISIVKV